MKYTITNFKKNTALRLFYYWMDCMRQIPDIIKEAERKRIDSKEMRHLHSRLHHQAHDYAVSRAWRF